MVPFPYRVGPEQRSSRPEYAHTPVPLVDLRPPDPSRIDLEVGATEGEHDQVDTACRTVDGVELVSERLVLRPASESDLDFYFEMRNRPELLARADHEPKPRSLVERQLRGGSNGGRSTASEPGPSSIDRAMSARGVWSSTRWARVGRASRRVRPKSGSSSIRRTGTEASRPRRRAGRGGLLHSSRTPPPSDRRRSIGSAVVEVALRNGHPPPRLRANERLAAV